MLKICSDKQLMHSMELAQKTKTEDQLIRWLLYLGTWHNKDETIVEIHADLPASPGFILWSAYHIEDGKKKGDHFYNGGLVFHHSTNEWGVHS